MKIAFKILSVLLIIWASLQIILGALLIFGSDMIFEYASEAGMAVGSLGAAGMIVSVVGVIMIVIAALMLIMGINGMRERMEKCRKFALGFLILTAINFILAIVKDTNTASAFLQVLFFGVYYFLAKMYMKFDNNY